jgi:hypothetical protein
MGRIKIEGIGEYGAKENILTYVRKSGRRLEKTV